MRAWQSAAARATKKTLTGVSENKYGGIVAGQPNLVVNFLS